MQSAVPLICDEVPGPPAGYTTLQCDVLRSVVIRRPMTVAEVERLKRVWQDEDDSQKSLMRGRGARVQWPDAEFCAA